MIHLTWRFRMTFSLRIYFKIMYPFAEEKRTVIMLLLCSLFRKHLTQLNGYKNGININVNKFLWFQFREGEEEEKKKCLRLQLNFY